MSTYYESVTHAATDKVFVNALAKEYSSPAEYSFEYLDTISKIFELKDRINNIESIKIYKTNDSFPVVGDKLVTIDPLESAWWYKEHYDNLENYNINDYIALSKKKVWTVVNSATGPLISLYKPLIFELEKLAGIIQFTINYDAVFWRVQRSRNVGQRISLRNKRE